MVMPSALGLASQDGHCGAPLLGQFRSFKRGSSSISGEQLPVLELVSGPGEVHNILQNQCVPFYAEAIFYLSRSTRDCWLLTFFEPTTLADGLSGSAVRSW